MKGPQTPPGAAPAHTFIPTGALDAWFTAKATAKTQPVGVLVMGDSIVQGSVTTDFRAQSFAGIVGATLATQLGQSSGEYFGLTESNTLSGGNVPVANRYWSFPAGTWALFDTNTGITGWSAASTSNNATAQFVPPAGVTFPDFDLIVHQEPNGSAFTVTVDGVTATPTSGTQTCTGAYVRHVVIQYGGYTSAAHTIVVQGAASAARTLLCGIMVYPHGRGAPGLVYTRVNLAGKTSYILKQLWPNTQPQYDGAYASIADFGPKLVVQALGTNDCGNFITYSFTRYAIARSITAAQSVGASHICLIPYRGVTALNGDAWTHYVEAIHGVARGLNAAVLDLQSAWSNAAGGAQAAGLAYTDDIHPTVAGHADIAARLLAMI